ncbi:unnamed protein product [Vicia faba]|uniref:Uncharacterized protein n=1 Tax=Vicia faba TaxID=3906 RepID=A0AAV1AV10_VICFA|nr:unnamed protein product [Vicia faba]
MSELVVTRLTTSDYVVYAPKWDSLTTFMVSILQNLKNISYEFVASSSQRQEQLEVKLAYVVGNQEVMATKQDVMKYQLEIVITRKDVMSYKLESIMEILKQNSRP